MKMDALINGERDEEKKKSGESNKIRVLKTAQPTTIVLAACFPSLNLSYAKRSKRSALSLNFCDTHGSSLQESRKLNESYLHNPSSSPKLTGFVSTLYFNRSTLA